MEKRDWKAIQNVLGFACDVICASTQLKPYSLAKECDKVLADTFYAMNSCWLHIQEIIEEEESNGSENS